MSKFHTAPTQRIGKARHTIVSMLQFYALVVCIFGVLIALLVYAFLMGAWQ